MRYAVNRGQEIKEGKLLDVIRERPAMYLGTRSISALSAYLHGFGFAEVVHGIDAPSQLPMDFHEWVAYRLHYYDSIRGWVNMILEQSPNESAALDKFYELLDEHRVRKARVVATIQETGSNWIVKWSPENLALIAYTDDPGVFLTGEGAERLDAGKDRLFYSVHSGITKEMMTVVDQEAFDRSFMEDERQGLSSLTDEKKLLR
jgi:hypothetical protein